MNTVVAISALLTGTGLSGFAGALAYPIVGTGQNQCFDAFHAIAPPQANQRFYWQDAQYRGVVRRAM